MCVAQVIRCDVVLSSVLLSVAVGSSMLSEYFVVNWSVYADVMLCFRGANLLVAADVLLIQYKRMSLWVDSPGCRIVLETTPLALAKRACSQATVIEY